MPLLHLDLPAIARADPDLLPPALLAAPVCVQLAHVGSRAHEAGLPRLHGLAYAGLAALRGPFYVNEETLRTALRCRRSPAGAYLVAALAGRQTQGEGALLGLWFTNAKDRWQLAQTPESPTRALDVRSLSLIVPSPAEPDAGAGAGAGS